MSFINQRNTPVVLNLLIINGLVYFAQTIFGGQNMPNAVMDNFALHHYKATVFQPHQIITHMFMHGGFFHLLFNMLALWMFGSVLEKIWGAKRFLIFYFICGIGAGLAQLASYTVNFWEIDHSLLSESNYEYYQSALRLNATVGASGAVMGLLAAYGYLFPNTKLFIMPIPFPVKTKWAIIGIIALDVFGGVVSLPGDNIAHFAHLGGALIGFLLVLYWYKGKRISF